MKRHSNQPNAVHEIGVNILNQLSQLNKTYGGNNTAMATIQKDIYTLIECVNNDTAEKMELMANLTDAQEKLIQNQEEIKMLNDSCDS